MSEQQTGTETDAPHCVRGDDGFAAALDSPDQPVELLLKQARAELQASLDLAERRRISELSELRDQVAAAEARASSLERLNDDLTATRDDARLERDRAQDRAKAAEARADLLQHERDSLREGLTAARDAMVAFGKQAGWLPAQQAYSCTMTQAEKDLADAVSSIDRMLATPHGGTDTTQPVEKKGGPITAENHPWRK